MWSKNVALVVLGMLLGWLGTTLSQGPSAATPEAPDRDALYQQTVEALEHPDFTERTVLVVNLLDQVTDENVEGMFQALQDNVQFTREQETRLIVREMARRDPQATLDAVLKWPANQAARGVQVTVFEWARINPVAAREAALKVGGGDKANEGAMRGLAYGWAYGRKPGLSEYIRSLPGKMGPGSQKMEFTVIQAAEILRHDGDQALLDWALEQAQHEDLDWAKLVVSQSMNALGAKKPESGAAFLEQYWSEPWASVGIEWLAERWATRDPQAAIAWAKTLPSSGQAQIRGMYYAWQAWEARAPFEAKAWLASAEAGPYLDGAVAARVDSIKRTDPPGAMAAALDIENSEFRRAVQITTLEWWFTLHQKNTEAWLAENPQPAVIVAEARDRSKVRKNKKQRLDAVSFLAEQEQHLLNP